jgi:ABC-type transporter lipoprotein component MlaA
MLYQVQTTLLVYQYYKSKEQRLLKLLSNLLASTQERSADEIESEERDVKKQTDYNRKMFQILDPRINFLKKVMHHYEYVLQSYARSAMFSKFENLESFLSGCNLPFPSK